MSMCGLVCLFKSGPIATPLIKCPVSEEEKEWGLRKQQTISATEVKIQMEHVDGFAPGGLGEGRE